MCPFVLRVECPDQPGIVAKITSCIAECGYTITDSSQFFEPNSDQKSKMVNGRFFLRLEFVSQNGCAQEVLLDEFNAFLDEFRLEFDASVSCVPKGRTVPTILMVSRFDHCLNDILYKVHTKSLPIEIKAVVSNHSDSRGDVERLGIPYHLLKVTKENKAQQEERLEEIISETESELIVLARYMQILSDEFSSRHSGKIINIHHSFLPAFVGAKPYHRAWERGVKHIGATAHYVTAELDEGPIIEQGTQRVSHTNNPEDLISLGRDVEAKVLSRAIRLHAEQRVFVNGRRTVVFQP